MKLLCIPIPDGIPMLGEDVAFVDDSISELVMSTLMLLSFWLWWVEVDKNPTSGKEISIGRCERLAMFRYLWSSIQFFIATSLLLTLYAYLKIIFYLAWASKKQWVIIHQSCSKCKYEYMLKWIDLWWNWWKPNEYISTLRTAHACTWGKVSF